MWRTNLTSDQIKDILKDLFDGFDPRYYWMVIWVERIFQHVDGNIVAETAFARIMEEELSSFKTSVLDLSRIKTVYLPAHLLPFISSGLIFKAGLIQFERHYTYLKAEKVKINVDGSKPQALDSWPLGEQLRKKLGFLNNDIPYETGRKKMFGKKSTIHVFPNSNSSIDADFLIYPSEEIARFYLFRSSRMAQGLIYPKSVSKKNVQIFYDPASLKLPSEEMPSHFLKIRDEMVVRDAFVIARMAFSNEARLAAAEIQRAVFNDDPFSPTKTLFISTFFPFTGEAPQEVYGMTISLDTVKVFLVLEISECYYQFPFTSLRFARESEVPRTDPTMPEDPDPWGVDPNKRENKEEGKDKTPEKKKEFWYNPTFDNDTTRNNTKKNDKKIANAVYVDTKVRFPNLTKDIQQIKYEKLVPPRKNERGIASIPVSNLSQNQQLGDKTDSTGLDIVSQEGEVERYYPGNYLDLMVAITGIFSSMNCEVRFHNGVDEEGQNSFCLFYIDVARLVLSSALKAFAKMSDDQARRVMAVSVKYKDKHFLIVELEPRGQNAYKIFHKNDFISPLHYSDVALIIDEIIKSQGSMIDLPKIYTHFRAYHEKTSPKTHAIRMLKNLQIY